MSSQILLQEVSTAVEMMKPLKASPLLISIDDLLETDPCIIIPKLLDSLPQGDCLVTSDSSLAPNQGHPKAIDIDYHGDDDFDPMDDLEDIIFGDVSPTRFFIPSSPSEKHAIVAQQAPSSTSWFSPIPSDAGYQGDDDFDPCDDLADEIFGDVSPSRYFNPSPSKLQVVKDDELYLPVTADIRTYSSSSSPDNSSEIDLGTEVCSPASQVSSTSTPSDDSDGRSQSDKNFNESLKETALALRSVLMDLDIIETYDRLGGDEFGDVLVEVRPRSLPDGPSLVAYKDAYGQITVPLEMGCNQHAAAILRKMVDEQNIDLKSSPLRISYSNSWQTNNDFDIFIPSSEIESDSDFESCDEEELMSLVKENYSRGHKRSRDELDSDDDDEDPMKTPPNSRHKIQRLD